MNNIFIFLSLAIFITPGYLVWPSRYNVVTHLSIGGNFIATFVPAIILNVQNAYPPAIVDLYANILLFGVVSFVIGLVIGFRKKALSNKFTFDIFSNVEYEKRAIRITKISLIIFIIMLMISYLGMGFIPAFAADPFLAKFFRGPYQEPYQRVAILFRTSFYSLSTIIPISSIIWYQTRKPFFLYATLIAVTLLAVSLSRSPAFMGILTAIALILSFKSKFHFKILLLIIAILFVFSSVFYYLIGARELDYSNFSSNHPYWEIVSSGSTDIKEQLQFFDKFIQRPQWTYGRTIYGGLIPGHYEWNPSVYSLKVMTLGEDLEDIVSGGTRLPVALWGYVSFGWVGVLLFCIISGFFYGWFLKYIKIKLSDKNMPLITKSIIVVIFNVVFANFYSFYILSIYFIPATALMLLYMYRVKLT